MNTVADLFSITHRGELYALGCAALWGVAVVFFRKAGDTIPPVALNLFKGIVGLGGFVVTLLVLGLPLAPPEASPSDWIILYLSGALGIGIADTLFFAGLNRIGAGLTAIVDCLYSPFVWLCSAFWLQEPTPPRLFLTLALMVGAILVGTLDPTDLSRTQPRQTRNGVILGAVAVLLMAIGIVVAKPVLNHTDPWWAATVRLSGGVSVLVPLGLLPSHRAGVIRAFRPGRHWWLLLPGAVIGAYLAMYCWIAGMKYAQTNVASVLNQSSTLFMLILAAIFLKEPLTLRRVLALILGFTGVLLVLQGS